MTKTQKHKTDAYINIALKKMAITFSGIFLISAGISHGDVLSYQGFEYGSTEGDLCTIASDDWSKDQTLDALYKSTSLSKSGSFSKGGSAKTKSNWTGSANNVVQTLNISLAGKNDFWVSLLISSDTASPPANSLARIIMTVKENDWQASRTYSVSKAWGSTTGFAFHTSGEGSIITGAEFSEIGTDTIRVVYYVKKSTIPEVWINPATTPVIGTGQSIGTATHGNLTTIEELQISFLGVVINMDEFIIGDTYADVTAPIPPKGTLISVR